MDNAQPRMLFTARQRHWPTWGAILFGLTAILLVGCGGGGSSSSPPMLEFTRPAAHQLSQTGPVQIELPLPKGADPASVIVRVDGGEPVSGITVSEGMASGTVSMTADGGHEVAAEVTVHGTTLETTTPFETVTLINPDECEILDQAHCMLPYPSSRFLEAADTPTGFHVRLPAAGMPVQNGAPLDPSSYASLDGFGSVGPILMYFPGGVDTAGSNAPRLWPDTRSYDTRSLDDDSPTVLIDLDTGERVLHFVEVDARAADQLDHQVLLLYPSEALHAGHHYAVAVRHLLHSDGSAIEAEAVFAALRDGNPSDIAALEARRAHFEQVFEALTQSGISRSELILAFDFVVRSEESVVADPLAMRAQALAWLDQEISAGSELFTVDSHQDYDCSAPHVFIGREIAGTYKAPLFLGVDPAADHATPAMLMRAADGTPASVGTTNTPFTIAIPCRALVENHPLPACVIGHGLFASSGFWLGYLASAANNGMPLPEAILGGSDWVGFTFWDSPVVTAELTDLNMQPAARDRFLQAQVNSVVWARMLKLGIFNQDPAFQTASGAGTLGGPAAELYYWGSSAGGAETAIPFLALSPDVDRALMDTPFSLGLYFQRSDGYAQYDSAINIADPLQDALVLSLYNDLQVGNLGIYARHIAADPLPDTNAKQVMFTHALFDQSVPNLSSEFIARTMQIPSLIGSVIHDRPGIPDLSGPLPSAFVAYDDGGFDADDPADASFITPLVNLPAPEFHVCDPHLPWPFDIPAVGQMALDFLQPDGAIENACDGLCDAGEPKETFCGFPARCDAANPWPTQPDYGCPAD